MNDIKCSKSLLFFVTEDWYFASHRLPIAIAAKKAGYTVSVVTKVNLHGDYIESHGIKIIPVELSRRSINVFLEVKLIVKLISIYRHERPDIVHHVALKPVLYGTFAARVTRVRSMVNAMAGLGLLFSSPLIKYRLIRPWLKLVIRLLLAGKNSKVILQNPDDLRFMLDNKVVSDEQAVLIRGSGVDVEKYFIYPEEEGVPHVILASRMLWDKGVGEFVAAAEQLKSSNVNARFILVGVGDQENPSSIPDSQLQSWHDKGVIEWWGHRDDMPEVFKQSHIVCLPSYYGEGVPKVLIEAASCGRPIVTTDSPGCREIVKDNVNGYLVPIRDASAVAKALKKLIESPELRSHFGLNGRNLVEKSFSTKKVNAQTLKVYKELVS